MKNTRNVAKIKALMEHYGYNQSQMADAIGVRSTHICEMIAGKRACGDGIMTKVQLNFPDVNPKWLSHESNEMLVPVTTPMQAARVARAGVARQMALNRQGTHECNMPAIIEVKESGVEVECPNCGEVIEVASTAVIPLVPPEVAKRPDVNLENFRHNCPQQMEEVDLRQVWGKGVFLMKVDTRAMEPEYREGTFLVLRRLKDLSYARPDGSAYVIDTMRPHTLFRYLSKERDGTYVLSAESDKRGPIYLNAEDIINIYDVVGSFRIGR